MQQHSDLLLLRVIHSDLVEPTNASKGSRKGSNREFVDTLKRSASIEKGGEREKGREASEKVRNYEI